MLEVSFVLAHKLNLACAVAANCVIVLYPRPDS